MEKPLGNGFHVSNDHNWKKTKGIDIQSPVFWIDEKTEDYVVVWGLGKWCVVYSKKGDSSWKQIPGTSDFVDMVYKDHKLYFLSLSGLGSLRIFDFSREIPQVAFQCGVDMNKYVFGTKLVVTVTGDVLTVEKMFDTWSGNWFFHIFKVCTSGVLRKCEKVVTLGDEAMILNLGITALANEIKGINRNSIYLDSMHANMENFLFNIKTHKTEPLQNFDCSSIYFSDIRWFLPQS